jgi:glycosyltransferase 2 family protein
MKRWLGLGLKFAFSAALIAYMAVTFDLGGAAERIVQADLFYLLLSILVFLVLLVNNTERWLVVLAAIGGRFGFWAAFRIMFIAIFLNQALPSTVGGDAARMYFSRRDGLDLAAAINGVMLERMVAVIGLILLVVATQPLLLARIGDNPAKYVFPALAAAAALGVGALMMLDRVPERWRQWTVVRGLVRLAEDTKRLFLHPGYAAAAIAMGVVGQVLISVVFFVLAKALHIDAIDLLDCLVLVPPVILITTIPISIAGWGLREGAMVTLFGLVGVAQGDSFVVSILFGLISIIVALPGGVIWLARGAGTRFDTAAPES